MTGEGMQRGTPRRIARLWRGTTREEDADAYRAYLERTGVADYRATPGNLGVHLLVRREGGVAEFLLLTLWEDWAAVRRFAGERVEVPVYYPEDRRYLLALAERVEHFEVATAG
jgi:heme-degrading monooxygenase HmoA